MISIGVLGLHILMLMAYLKIDEIDSVQQKIKVSRIRQLLTLSQEGRRDIDQTFWFCLTNETKYNADNCPGTFFIYGALIGAENKKVPTFLPQILSQIVE